jgi:lipoprotein-releasing system permease protein
LVNRLALLELISKRIQMNGIRKAVSADDWSTRKTVLYDALFRIGKGLFWGTAIGIGILLIQNNSRLLDSTPNVIVSIKH